MGDIRQIVALVAKSIGDTFLRGTLDIIVALFTGDGAQGGRVDRHLLLWPCPLVILFCEGEYTDSSSCGHVHCR